MLHTDIHLLARVALACAFAFSIGFERQLRGSPAGNRTFVLIGGTAAAVTSVAGRTSPQAVAGILTGIGFIGAGVVFIHGPTIRGLTSAATVFATAGIGIVLGYGHLYLGLFIAIGFLFMLELQHIPGLRFLDASTYADRFANDYEVRLGEPVKGIAAHAGDGAGAGDPPGGPGRHAAEGRGAAPPGEAGEPG